eukprot:COSAG05_NODE_141_length_16655_cov_22.580963_8_plen_76_part_00
MIHLEYGISVQSSTHDIWATGMDSPYRRGCRSHMGAIWGLYGGYMGPYGGHMGAICGHMGVAIALSWLGLARDLD